MNRHPSDTAQIYDAQASSFDKRTGLGKESSHLIATAIQRISDQFHQPQLLEIGCGTGELGTALATCFHTYLGIDISAAMLEKFREEHSLANVSLIQADANSLWPVDDNSIDVIFSSRALHRINLSHTVKQLYRVARTSEALLIVGRLVMDSDSWEAELRRKCLQLVQEQGLTPLKGEAHLKTLQEMLARNKADIFEPEVVCRLHHTRTPIQALQDWQNKPGLAGIPLPGEKKASILRELNSWIESNFTNFMPTECARQYVLYGMRLHSK